MKPAIAITRTPKSITAVEMIISRFRGMIPRKKSIMKVPMNVMRNPKKRTITHAELATSLFRCCSSISWNLFLIRIRSSSSLVNSSVVIVITIITIGANGYKCDDDDILPIKATNQLQVITP